MSANPQIRADPSREIDTGTAYGRKVNRHDPLLTEVGPGTPMGELFRRYWHPIAVSSDVTADLPQRARVLGEDLVLFRDKGGRVGLVIEKCRHRGTSLFYGRIEEDGIRCAYHGWKFDVQGRCLEMACEVGGGRPTAAHRQPWYPVEERYGVVWAYMGPPDRKPVLPRWEMLENLQGEQTLGYICPSFGYGPSDALDFNWLQSYENTIDVLHAVWLHIGHSKENQFVGAQPAYTPDFDPSAFIKLTSWSDTENGVQYEQVFPINDGMALHYCVEAIIPNVNVIPTFAGGKLNKIQWHVPIDDTRFRIFVIHRFDTRADAAKVKDLQYGGILHNGKQWREMSDAEHQRYPADYEAQSGQGKIAVQADEHLVRSDTGVVMLRRKLAAQVRRVEEGKDPVGLSFEANAPPRSTTAYGRVGPMAAG